jgi:hypothetical protein
MPHKQANTQSSEWCTGSKVPGSEVPSFRGSKVPGSGFEVLRPRFVVVGACDVALRHGVRRFRFRRRRILHRNRARLVCRRFGRFVGGALIARILVRMVRDVRFPHTQSRCRKRTRGTTGGGRREEGRGKREEGETIRIKYACAAVFVGAREEAPPRSFLPDIGSADRPPRAALKVSYKSDRLRPRRG